MVLIYAEQVSNRLEYICGQLFRHVLGFECRLTDSLDELRAYDGPSVCYASAAHAGSLHIAPCGLLSETSVTLRQPSVSEWRGMPVFFRTDGADFPFDVFSASFFLITRYEEYFDGDPDGHGRFKAQNSLAYRNGFLERPVVDEWAVALGQMLREKFGALPENPPAFRFVPTIDVDHAFAFRHKGLIVNGYKFIKALLARDWDLAGLGLRVISRVERDPFFNFRELKRLHAPCASESTVFFHCGGRGRFDKRTFVPSLRYFLAKRKLAGALRLGLHPSYRAADRPWLFRAERWVMERAVEGRVAHCRYHYLKFTIPQSYLFLSGEGFTDDWSMVYSNDPGFRAGTSFPFRFYNLADDRVYDLTIHPTAVMDKTLLSNRGMDPDEAYDYILRLSERVRAVNGSFVTLFHNDHLTDAFADWRGWAEMYERLLRHFAGGRAC